MPGLIDTQVKSTKDEKLPDDPNQVKTVTATSYDPAQRTVDKNQTVAGNLDSILSKDSPLVTQARAGAAETANARGLVNSSMAAGAGESAAISAALPIATADANTYGVAASQNMDALNTAGQFGANATNRAGEVSANAVNAAQTIKQQAEAQKGIITAQTQSQSTLSAQAAAQSEALTRVQGGIQSGLSAQDAIQREAQSRVDAELQKGIITTQEQASARLSELSGQLQSQLSAQQSQQQQAEVKLRGEVETGLQQLRGTQATDLANIEAQYKQLMQSSSSAASMYNEAMQNIANILRDPNTSAEQKSSSVNGEMALLKSGLDVTGSIANLNFGGLVDFSNVATAPTGTNGSATATPPAPLPAASTTDFTQLGNGA